MVLVSARVTVLGAGVGRLGRLTVAVRGNER